MYFHSTSECIVWYTIHAFWLKIKLEQLQITILKRSFDLRKTISFFQRHFQGYRPNMFSKFLWLGDRFCGLWYTLPLCFMEYWTEVMLDVVLKRSRDIMQFLSWYCANTVPNLSLVISETYDVLKHITEYF